VQPRLLVSLSHQISWLENEESQKETCKLASSEKQTGGSGSDWEERPVFLRTEFPAWEESEQLVRDFGQALMLV